MDKVDQSLEEIKLFINSQAKFLSPVEYKDFLESLINDLEERLNELQRKVITDLQS